MAARLPIRSLLALALPLAVLGATPVVAAEPVAPASVLAVTGGTSVTAQRLKEAPPFAVFVDEETRFAFVRTPSRWRFMRQLDRDQMTRLHPDTIVASKAERAVDGESLAARTAAGTALR